VDKNVIRPRLYHLATIGHKEEFEKLQERIGVLEAALQRLDNWEGYGYAMELLQEKQDEN